MSTSPAIAFAHARYRAGAELGRGAQGAVLEVQDTNDPTRALVAKLYRPGLLAEASLRSEFALLARMRVPGLVRAHDLSRNELDGAPFLVEDRVDGPDALQWVQEARAHRVERLLRVLVGTARSLAALHEAGFLHGDLKPAHVRIAGELPVLLDLGAAIEAAAQARVQTFTRSYAAPEVRAGGRADPRSDLYGLGALAWAAAVGESPAQRPDALRTRAAWVPPRIADLIDRLLALHPQDRVGSALELLGLLGQAAQPGPLPAAIGRSSQLQELLAPGAACVRYLVGEPGSGKSHLLRELRVRALLDGQRVVMIDAREGSAAWLAVMRGQTLPASGAPQLLLVDGLDDVGSELQSAIESYRVVSATAARLRVIVAARTAPAGAERIELGALSTAELTQLAAALGVAEPARAQLVVSAAGSPGWLVATLGRVPLTAAAVMARTRDLSVAACDSLAAVAAVGGRSPAAWLGALELEVEAATAELLQAGLLRRRSHDGEPVYEIEAASLCAELTRTLASPELIAKLARVLLAAEPVPARALLALAPPAAPDVRSALLSAAARGARVMEAREIEIDALLALGRNPAERNLDLLARLERLLRDAGRHAEHTEVVSWLEAAAIEDPRIRALALRRAAEQRARAGDKAAALQLADTVLEDARRSSDALSVAQALATRGAVLLFSSDHTAAATDLDDAHVRFAKLEPLEDREELARLDHNLGVVATYRGELERAREHFEAALRTKQALGDRAGMRACLRNLGYAALHAGDYAEATRWLDQALALARSLGQVAGEAWSRVTIAELEARRGDAVRAERQLAEVEALPGELPAALRADVALVRADLALVAGDFETFDAAIACIDPELRRSDAQVDANTFILLARAGLVRRRAAASCILQALRRARGARLALPLREARRVLADVWRARAHRPEPAADSGSATFVETLSTVPGDQVAAAFARHLLAVSHAERVFVVRFEGSEMREVVGLDMDGLHIAEPERRIDVAAARAALVREAAASEATADRRGSRVWFTSRALGEQRWLALAEQRFLPNAFAGLGQERVRELTALLSLSARLAAGSQRTAAAAAPSSGLTSSSALPTIAPRHSFPGIIGSSRALRSALARLDAAIDSDLPLLLTGETGVGKELFARAVAELGPRRGKPFVAVNCAAIAGSLFEAELFGHERGAFTGADRRRSGVFVQADTGVLLLDEIGELRLPQQVALLRALETQRVRPLGADGERKFDVRLIAATNRDLDQAVADGSFRRDLMYRINVLEVRIPPLRERADDIEALALHFLRAHGSQVSISAPALRAMAAYSWPGNVRELAHTVLRLSALHDQRIELNHLPRQLRGARAKAQPVSIRRVPDDPRDEVLQTLEQTGGNISHAARVLGLTRHGLKKRMLRLGLRRPRGETA